MRELLQNVIWSLVLGYTTVAVVIFVILCIVSSSSFVFDLSVPVCVLVLIFLLLHVFEILYIYNKCTVIVIFVGIVITDNLQQFHCTCQTWMSDNYRAEGIGQAIS